MPYRRWFSGLTEWMASKADTAPTPHEGLPNASPSSTTENAPSAAVELVYDHRAPRGHRARN